MSNWTEAQHEDAAALNLIALEDCEGEPDSALYSLRTALAAGRIDLAMPYVDFLETWVSETSDWTWKAYCWIAGIAPTPAVLVDLNPNGKVSVTMDASDIMDAARLVYGEAQS